MNVLVPELPTVKTQSQMLKPLTIDKQLGLSCEQLAAARVSAVETHLLKKQEEILTSITNLRESLSTLTKTKNNLLSDWVEEQETIEGEKIGNEISKLSFVKNLSIKASSSFIHDDDKKTTQHPSLTVTIYLLPESSSLNDRNSIKIKTIKIKRSKELIKQLDTTESQINSLNGEITKESKRLEKIGGYLSNMDREERRAKAMLVEARMKSMEGGQEMMEALIMDMPNI